MLKFFSIKLLIVSLTFAVIPLHFAKASASVTLDVRHQVLQVSSLLYFYGPEATKENAVKSRKEIDDIFNRFQNYYFKLSKDIVLKNNPELKDGIDKIFRYGSTELWVKVYFKIRYKIIPEDDALKATCADKNAADNFIKINYNPNRSTVHSFYSMSSNYGYFDITTDQLGHDKTAAHEYGHGLGLEHPFEEEKTMLLHSGRPGIMWARGQFVDQIYQRNQQATIGDRNNGGVMDPAQRALLKSELEEVLNKNLKLRLEKASHYILGSIGNAGQVLWQDDAVHLKNCKDLPK